MECPDLALFPIYYQEDIFEEMARRHVAAFYRSLNNTIYLRQNVILSDEDGADKIDAADVIIDFILIHELTHWATVQILSVDERQKFVKNRCVIDTIFEHIAYLTELSFVLDELEHHYSIDEALKWTDMRRNKWSYLLDIDVRHWCLIDTLCYCKKQLNDHLPEKWTQH